MLALGALIVAPRAGAWIETSINRRNFLALMWSRPARARGLKLYIWAEDAEHAVSRPARARGLKRLNSP